MKIWSCKIGECDDSDLLRDGKYYGADWPMRQAIAEAYRQVMGREPNFIFSRWGAQLEEIERAVVENRPPQEVAQPVARKAEEGK